MNTKRIKIDIDGNITVITDNGLINSSGEHRTEICGDFVISAHSVHHLLLRNQVGMVLRRISVPAGLIGVNAHEVITSSSTQHSVLQRWLFERRKCQDELKKLEDQTASCERRLASLSKWRWVCIIVTIINIALASYWYYSIIN